MDLRFTPEEEAFRARVRAWVAENLPADIREKVDRGIELDRPDYERWMRILGERRWLAVNWDEKDGGPGFTTAEKFLFEEELFRGGAPRTIHFGTRMVGPVLLAYGTDEQKRKYLPKIVSGEEIWCQGYSEPGAGSDLASLSMSAVRDGDHYVVNGSKIWTSYAHCADRMFALVRTARTAKKQEGISCLLIDLKLPGVRVEPIDTIDGRHHLNQEFFDDVRVPVSDRVGDEGQGWAIAKYLLGHERSNASYISIIKRNFETLERIAATESADGRPLAEDPAFASRMAELRQEIELLEVTALRELAVAAADRPVDLGKAGIIKMRVGDLLQKVSELMVIAGGPYAAPFDAEAIREGWGNREPMGPDHLFRMVPDYCEYRAMSIAGGSHEVQRNVIAKAVLGL